MGFGPQFGEYFLSTNQNDINKTHFFISQLTGAPLVNISKRCPCAIQRHIYYNSSIFYSSYYANGSSAFFILTNGTTVAYDKDYAWCANVNADVYG